MATVTDLYASILARQPDPEGLVFWTAQFGDSIDAAEQQQFIQAAQSEIAVTGAVPRLLQVPAQDTRRARLAALAQEYHRLANLRQGRASAEPMLPVAREMEALYGEIGGNGDPSVELAMTHLRSLGGYAGFLATFQQADATHESNQMMDGLLTAVALAGAAYFLAPVVFGGSAGAAGTTAAAGSTGTAASVGTTAAAGSAGAAVSAGTSVFTGGALTDAAIAAGLGGSEAITTMALTAGGSSAATGMAASAALTGSATAGLIGGAMPILNAVTGQVVGTTATIGTGGGTGFFSTLQNLTQGADMSSIFDGFSLDGVTSTVMDVGAAVTGVYGTVLDTQIQLAQLDLLKTQARNDMYATAPTSGGGGLSLATLSIVGGAAVLALILLLRK